MPKITCQTYMITCDLERAGEYVREAEVIITADANCMLNVASAKRADRIMATLYPDYEVVYLEVKALE